MKTNLLRFSYLPKGRSSSDSVLPFLPITLHRKEKSIAEVALLDSGSTVNVLPYSFGVRLGAIWEKQKTSVQLSGNLSSVDARGMILSATIDSLTPVRLVFAWVKSDNVPIILGQMNFFQEFEICFFGAEKFFEIQLKTKT